MSLGNKIREIRKNNNLTQEQFAQKFHVTRQTVSNWENDKNYPDLSSLKEISEEYAISFDELFKGDEKYIKAVDDTKRKMPLFKKALITSLIILSVVVAAFCVTARGRQNCLWESVARGPALINNRGVSRGLKRESPSRRRGLTEGKGYDEARHHTGDTLSD